MCSPNPVFIALSVVISQALLLGLVYFMVMALSPLASTSVSPVSGQAFVPGLLCGRTVPFGLTYQSWLGLALVLVLEPCGLGCEASWSFALRLPSRFSLGPSPAAAQAQPVAPSFVPAAGVGQR